MKAFKRIFAAATLLVTTGLASEVKAQQFTSALVMRGAFNLNIRESEGATDGVPVYTFYAESYNYAIEFNCIEGQTATMKIISIVSVD